MKKKLVQKYTCDDMGITLWKVKERTHDAGGGQDMTDGYRACIEHSVWDLMSGKWRRQQIWIKGTQLDYLLTILEPMIRCYLELEPRGR